MKIKELQRKQAELKSICDTLKEKVTVRPTPSEFSNLYSDLSNISSTLVDPNKIFELLALLEKSSTSSSQEVLWQDRAQDTINKLSSR